MKISDIKVVEARTLPSAESIHEIYNTPERDVLVLNYTLACPLSCDFCCYGCHPKRKEKMDLEAAKDLVSQAAQMDNFSSVGLTGGEVFMFEDELISLSEHIANVGLRFTVATSAHWAKTPLAADTLARTLVRNGLSRANISFDYSHAQFVPARSIVNAACAFSALGIPVFIVGTYFDAKDSLEAELEELRGVANIELFTRRVAKVGRATKANIAYASTEVDSVKACYRRRHHDLVVFWDGEAYPCCSTFNRATKGISIGNAFKTPLRVLWQAVEYSRLIRTMKAQGFSKVIEIVRKYEPEFADRLPSLDEFPGACSYCNSIFSDSSLTQAIRAIFARYETEEIVSSMDELNALLGEAAVARLLQASISSAAMEVGNG